MAFEWGRNNLRVETPQELQSRSVNVYFAPNISPETLVVNLDNGLLTSFGEGEDRPQSGQFADYEGLRRYCDQTGIPLSETNGQISVLPIGFREAGDPLHHEGH